MHQDPSSTLLHHAPDRRARLRDNRLPLFFDALLNSWVIVDPRLAAAALTDARFAEVDYHDANATLARVSGLPLLNIDFTLTHNPISRDGPKHVAQRRAAARHVADHRRAAEAATMEAIAAYAGRFADAGELEVMGEVIVPMVHTVIGAMVGVPIDADETAGAMSRVFDRLGSVRRSAEADRQIGDARERLRAERGSPMSDEEMGAALSLWILGYDALIGTLGESLRYLFERHNGLQLSQIPFPDNPPETGVAYVARKARGDFDFAGASIKQGQRIRVTLQSSAYSDDPKQQVRMFGAGAHSCLGRPLALDLWRLLTERLRTIDLRVEFLGSKLRDQDYLFIFPEYLRVTLT